jgi:hypothetical protein
VLPLPFNALGDIRLLPVQKTNNQIERVFIMKSNVVAPGSKLIRTAGILYIIFGVIALLLAIVGINTAEQLENIISIQNMSWDRYFGSTIVSSIFIILVGIVGVAYANRPEKASWVRAIAWVEIVHAISFMVLGIVVYTKTSDIVTVVASTIIGFIFPIMYLIGAQRNLKAYRKS